MKSAVYQSRIGFGIPLDKAVGGMLGKIRRLIVGNKMAMPSIRNPFHSPRVKFMRCSDFLKRRLVEMGRFGRGWRAGALHGCFLPIPDKATRRKEKQSIVVLYAFRVFS